MKTKVKLTAKETDTILAALRVYQLWLAGSLAPAKVPAEQQLAIQAIAEEHGEPLDAEQIDDLCESIKQIDDLCESINCGLVQL